MKKVSIIVPVYNVERYIEKCLETLVNQTIDDYEIIVVNDGSPDGSQKIIDGFVSRYPQLITAYIKSNGGLGDARNYGIERANGEYIGFVDSDDWVDERMFECMYNMAKREDDDIVICDLVEINDGWENGKIAKGYRGDRAEYPISKYSFVMNALNPAMACNKLFRRTLFDLEVFKTQWYEDMATTPILLSYAERIGYLSMGLYYYRQTGMSITKTSGDRRTLDVIKAWNICLDKAKSEYKEAIEVAVYNSIVSFVSFKPEFAQDFIDYANQNKDIFENNKVICKLLSERKVENIFQKELIPAKIHYFWFGGNPKSELINRCIESWKKNAPNFEIIEWNESNCDIHVNHYVEEAYKAKKWAFVADYFRMEKIAEYGGIYFDTDVELMRDANCLRLHPAFFSFETHDAVNACVFGAIPHHQTVINCKKSYERENFIKKDGTYNTSFTIVKRITNQLKKHGLILNGKEQTLKNQVHIYPPNKLTIDVFDGEIIAQHHYDCSWWDAKVGVASYKNTVLEDYFAAPCDLNGRSHNRLELENRLAYYKAECNRYEASTCWKITAPLRWIADVIKGIFSKKAIKNEQGKY